MLDRPNVRTVLEHENSIFARPGLILKLIFVQCPLLACAVQRRRFPVGASPTRQSLQPEAIGAVMEVTKWLTERDIRFLSMSFGMQNWL
jgi:ABC-type sulfate transport system permease subunit